MRSSFLVPAAVLTAALVGASSTLAGCADQPHRDEARASEIPIGGDLLTAGDVVELQRQIPGDLAAAGRRVTIAAPVDGYVMSAGRTVTLDATIGNDLWAAAEVVEVGGDIGNNLIAAGRRVLLREDAVVGESALIGGETVTIDGRIERNVRIGATTARIGGEIGGIVDARARQVVVLPGAVVHGDLHVVSPEPPAISPGARVLGQVRHEQPERASRWTTWPVWWLAAFLALWVLGSVVLAMSQRWTDRVAETIRERWGASVVSGLGLLVGAPILIGLLAVTLVGIPLALALLAVYVLALILAGVFVSYRVGDWLLDRFRRREASPWWRMAIGALVVSLAMAAPAIGWLMCLAVMVLGAGALVLERRRARGTLGATGAQ